MVEYAGGDEDFVRGIAMQIAAMSPQYVTREDVPSDVLAHERHIAELTAKEEGKPEQIIPRIVEGRSADYSSRTWCCWSRPRCRTTRRPSANC